MKGTLTNYRYDLTLEMTPDERITLIELVRRGMGYFGVGTEQGKVAQELLSILQVKP